MDFLELLLFLFVLYWLLGGRRTRPTIPKPLPQRTRDAELEEALRTIRDVLRSETTAPASQPQPSTYTNQASAFRNLEQTGPEWRAPVAAAPATALKPERPAAPSTLSLWVQRLAQPKALQEAYVMAELLSAPRARRPWRPRIGLEHVRFG